MEKDLSRLEERVISMLKKDNISSDAIAEELRLDPEFVDYVIDRIRERIPVRSVRQNGVERHNINVHPDIGNVYDFGGHDGKRHTWSFAYMGDTHVASIFHLPKTTHAALDRLVDLGVKHVFHSGDVIDGRGIYKGHSENIVSGDIEVQTDMAAELFSRYDGKLRFNAISGNHDFSFTQLTGARPLAIIEAKTNNFKNLGDLRADVLVNDLRIRLLHGAGGRSYAVSYPSQTYLRDYFKGLDREQMTEIPHFLFLGHFHTKYHSKDHGIEVFQPGSFQDGDNEYCVRRGLTGPAGLWHLEVTHTGAVIEELKATYIQPVQARKEKGSAFASMSKSYSR